MAEVTIDDLPLAAALTGTEKVPMWQAGATVQAPVSRTVAMAQRVAVNNQSGAAYTFALSDTGGVVRTTNGSAVTLTVPTNATTAFPSGSIIEIRQIGAGIASIVPVSGSVTINVPAGFSASVRQQGGTVYLHKVATDEWDLFGDLAPSGGVHAISFAAMLTTSVNHTSTGNYQKIPFATEGFDVGSLFDLANKRWTPGAGTVMLSARVSMSPGAGEDVGIAIYKNGSELLPGQILTSEGDPVTPAVSLVDYADAGDYYEAFAYQSSGGDLAYTANGAWFTGAKLRP